MILEVVEEYSDIGRPSENNFKFISEAAITVE